jgi:DNA-binding PadR family transcriptional regulator
VRRKQELLVGEWAVLALLCERPAHGYAIAAAMAPDGELGAIWSLGQALTYRTLRVLRSLDLIEVAAVKPGEQAPQRVEFQATAKGKRMVTRWLARPEPHVRDLRSSLLLKVHLLHRRGRSPIELLVAQRELLAGQAKALAVAEQSDSAAGALVRRWRCTMTDAALRFLDETLDAERASEASTPALARPRRRARSS